MPTTEHALARCFRDAAIVAVAVFAAGGLSLYLPLEGAVVMSGTLVVETNVKKIQHASGGVVAEIGVREGQRVAAGDLLIRLHETAVRANLEIVLNGLRTARARLSRLEALRDGRKDLAFPAQLTQDPTNARMLAGEARLAAALATAQDDQKRALLERIEQLRQEEKGLAEQHRSAAGQLQVVQTDLDDLRPLFERGNIQRPRISILEREALRNQGAVGDALAKIAQTKAKIAETELQIARNQHDFVAEISKELRETETQVRELEERHVAAQDLLSRLEIRAPLSGTVHQLAVHTVGGVLGPGDVAMLIVPEGDRLLVETRVRPGDIDQLATGQAARLRFTAFGRRLTEEVSGTLVRVAADLSEDRRTGLSYYSAAVRIDEHGLAHLDGLKVVAGMPVEVLITTGERTLASYIIKPIQDQMHRALRER
jgi:HlyD family secretion protein